MMIDKIVSMCVPIVVHRFSFHVNLFLNPYFLGDLVNRKMFVGF